MDIPPDTSINQIPEKLQEFIATKDSKDLFPKNWEGKFPPEREKNYPGNRLNWIGNEKKEKKIIKIIDQNIIENLQILFTKISKLIENIQ